MKLDLSNAWADAMGLLRGHLELVLTLAGAFMLLPTLLLGFFAPLKPTAQTLNEMIAEISRYMQENGGLLLLSSLVGAFGALAIAKLLLDPGRPTVGQSLARALRLLPWYFLTGLIVGLIVLFGGFLFVIPGLYLWGRLGLSTIVVAAEERRNPFDALGRTWRVTAGNGWRIFFLTALIWVVGWVVTTAVSLIIGIATAVSGGALLGGFLNAFVEALFSTALALVILLVQIAIYRQLGREVSVPSTSGT